MKEVDKDGSFVYSRIAEVTIDGQQSFNAYPNPVKDNITLKINTTAQKNVLSLFDAGGRLVMRKEVLSVNGDNTIIWNINGLAPGIYYIEAGKTGMRTKIIKQ